MSNLRMEVAGFSKKQSKTMLYGILYGAASDWVIENKKPKTARELANERWHTAEHIRVNSLPVIVGRTSSLLTQDGEPDVYALLTEFLFKEDLIERTGEAEFFPTYVVLPDGCLIPYGLENPGKRNETLLVWI